jgi:hypothetical protein
MGLKRREKRLRRSRRSRIGVRGWVQRSSSLQNVRGGGGSLEVSVYRADPVTGLDFFSAASPVLSALVAIVGVLATLWFTNRWQQQRLEHERAVRMRDERIAVYRKMLTASTTAHTDRDAVDELSAAYVEISLLASTDALDQAAAKVRDTYARTQRLYAKAAHKERVRRTPDSLYAQDRKRAEAARDRFLALAREELGIEGRTAGFRDLEGDSTAEEAQEPAERRPWYQRIFGP